MKIFLSNSAFIGNIDSFLRGFDPAEPSKLEIQAHKTWIALHPVAWAMVAALGVSVGPDNIHMEKLEATSKHYPARVGLFDLLKIPHDIVYKEHEAAGRFIPLQQIKNIKDLDSSWKEMVPILHLPPEKVEPLRYIISELIRNVFEHSESLHGAILGAQYYKKSNTIRIGIADLGVGIRKTINVSHKAYTHMDALQLALTPGITGTTRKEGGTERNAGAGLFFTKSIAIANKSFFMIYSGNALYKALKPATDTMVLHADPFDDNHSKREDLPHWPGTVVGVDIVLDTNTKFSALLDGIRDIYVQAVRERKKEKYKKPKFL